MYQMKMPLIVSLVSNVMSVSYTHLNIIKYTCKVSFDEDSVYYYRFITHLKFFAQRLLTHTEYQSDEDVYKRQVCAPTITNND